MLSLNSFAVKVWKIYLIGRGRVPLSLSLMRFFSESGRRVKVRYQRSSRGCREESLTATQRPVYRLRPAYGLRVTTRFFFRDKESLGASWTQNVPWKNSLDSTNIMCIKRSPLIENQRSNSSGGEISEMNRGSQWNNDTLQWERVQPLLNNRTSSA